MYLHRSTEQTVSYNLLVFRTRSSQCPAMISVIKLKISLQKKKKKQLDLMSIIHNICFKFFIICRLEIL